MISNFKLVQIHDFETIVGNNNTAIYASATWKIISRSRHSRATLEIRKSDMIYGHAWDCSKNEFFEMQSFRGLKLFQSWPQISFRRMATGWFLQYLLAAHSKNKEFRLFCFVGFQLSIFQEPHFIKNYFVYFILFYFLKLNSCLKAFEFC